MNAYLVTVKTPKKQAGKFFITRGVVIGETLEKAVKSVKEDYYTNGARGWGDDAQFEFVGPLAPGFFPV